MIRFLLHDRERAVDGLPADTTVLEYLRDREGLCGTKEGCASGDCGACTVVLATPTEHGLVYTPLNACIAPLGRLHGTQLITVEHLAEGGALHPVQRAMVNYHGSQCGFCTPGFVMSLFALYKRHAGREVQRAEVLEALGGNLCRCTGYRPIVDAAHGALASPGPDVFSGSEERTRVRLLEIADSPRDGAVMRDAAGAYLRPPDIASVCRLLGEIPDARLVAGATDLLLEVTQGMASLPTLIDISAVPELTAVMANGAGLRLGAGVTHCGAQEALLPVYPELAELIERFGSLQIRSHGTLGGNVANASPVGDWPPVLIALNARLELCSARGRRTLPAEDFFLDYRQTALQPGEFLVAILLPPRPPALRLRAWKISKRFEDDISSVCAVFALRMDGEQINEARIACGGMAAVPARARCCEAALTRTRIGDAATARAMAALDGDYQPVSDARASARYRLQALKNLLCRLQFELTGSCATRVHALETES